MSAIRPLERADLPQVVSLYEHVARSGSRTPPPGLAAYFERTFLDHPWADAEIPSLVYADGDKILGFLGSSVRKLELEGRPGAHGDQRPAGDGARSAKARGGRVPDARVHVRCAGPDDHRHRVRHGSPDLGRGRRRDESARVHRLGAHLPARAVRFRLSRSAAGRAGPPGEDLAGSGHGRLAAGLAGAPPGPSRRASGRGADRGRARQPGP